MSVVVYADFSDPACYLASRRAELLAAEQPVDWRAVDSRPRQPVTGRPVDAAGRREIEQRFAALQQELLPEETLPWVAPGLVPNTGAAVSAYAEAHGTPVDAEVRRVLFELYWRDGADIGSPNVLRTPLAGPMMRSGVDSDPIRQFGYAVAQHRGPITAVAVSRIAGWRAEWEALESPELPVLLIGGATLSGMDAVRRLGKEIVATGVSPDTSAEDPRRYPVTAFGDPPRTWVSQIGGDWLLHYRVSSGR